MHFENVLHPNHDPVPRPGAQGAHTRGKTRALSRKQGWTARHAACGENRSHQQAARCARRMISKCAGTQLEAFRCRREMWMPRRFYPSDHSSLRPGLRCSIAPTVACALFSLETPARHRRALRLKTFLLRGLCRPPSCAVRVPIRPIRDILGFFRQWPCTKNLLERLICQVADGGVGKDLTGSQPVT